MNNRKLKIGQYCLLFSTDDSAMRQCEKYIIPVDDRNILHGDRLSFENIEPNLYPSIATWIVRIAEYVHPDDKKASVELINFLTFPGGSKRDWGTPGGIVHVWCEDLLPLEVVDWTGVPITTYGRTELLGKGHCIQQE